MDRLRTTLSAYQTVSLVSSSYLPVMFWFFPAVAVDYAKFDAQWAVLGVALVGCFSAWIQGALNERFPDRVGTDAHQLIFGKWLGKLIIWMYVPPYILFLGLTLYFGINLFKYYFPATPQYAIGAMLIAVSWRGAWLGIETLGRVATVIFTLSATGMLAAFITLYLQADRHWMSHTVAQPMSVFEGIYHLCPLYFGLNLVIALSPYYKHKKNTTIWYPVLSTMLAGSMIFILFCAVVANLGWMPLTKLTYPVQMALQLLRPQGFLIERLGVIIIVLSVGLGSVFQSNHIWALSTVIARLMGQADDRFRRFTGVIVLCEYLVALSISNPAQARQIENYILSPFSWVLLIITPGIELLVAYVRGIKTGGGGGAPNAKPPQHDRQYRKMYKTRT
ncbi:hypothetical protein AAC03nite_18970 [Alicyclobacillus acidoterrestris]|nr:hypothetical protein AAC03nite_18970 [Alicyclobacillus acidoterrestris]